MQNGRAERIFNKRALTISEAAEYACVSRAVVDSWLVKGMLAYEELPGSGSGVYRFRRIRLADLDAFLDGFRQGPKRPEARKARPQITLDPRST